MVGGDSMCKQGLTDHLKNPISMNPTSQVIQKRRLRALLREWRERAALFRGRRAQLARAEAHSGQEQQRRAWQSW